MTPAEYKPDGPSYASQTSTPGPLSGPERAEIQARTSDPVAHLPPERPHTASPDQHGAPHVDHTTAPVTPTPMLDDHDAPDLYDSHKVESVPVRENTLFPMQLPPLPTTRSQPAHLDISHGGEEGGPAGSGQGESSGSGEGGSSDGGSSGAEVGAVVSPTQVRAEPTSSPDRLLETTTGSEWEIEITSTPSQLLDITAAVVIPEIHTPEPGLPAKTPEAGQQPAVVFKEDATPGTTLTSHLDQSPAVPVDGESSAKPPFHLIIVNVHDQNQSGELRR